MCDATSEPSKKNIITPSKASGSRLKSLLFKDIGNAAMTKIKAIKKSVLDRINNASLVRTLKGYYNRRTDLGFLVALLSAVLFAICAYKIKNFLFPAPPKYTKAQLNSASNLPINDFTIDEVAVADLEADALRRFNDKFTSEPYSAENSGIKDLQVSVVLLPIIMFIIMYVMPVVTVIYIFWFVIKYWAYVISAAWGFFMMLYRYMDDKVTGALGCKWYIKMATGWSCEHPQFSEYFYPWKAQFVDRPIYLESLKYLEQYIAARRKYYEVPYEQYITIPLEKAKISLKYAKKVYIDRTMDVYLRKFKEKYPAQYDLPRNEFYHWLLNDKKAAASLYARRRRAEFEFDDIKNVKDRY